MLSPKLTAVALLLLAALFATGNLYVAACRSTIPLQVDGTVQGKERLAEKHGGFDDVLLLNLGDQRTLHVDRPVYEAVAPGQRIRKQAWSSSLEVAGEAIPLAWSADAKGMLFAMPASLLVVALTCWLSCSPRVASREPVQPADIPDGVANRSAT